MKKCSVRIGVLSVVFSSILMVLPPGTKAETREGPEKDPVSEIHLESAGLQGQRTYSADEKELKDNPLRGFLIPLKEGLNAFIDCAPPPHQEGLTPKDTHTDYRAVIGFHFRLR